MAKQIIVKTAQGTKGFIVARAGMETIRSKAGAYRQRQYKIMDAARNVLAVVLATNRSGSLEMFASEASGRGNRIEVGRKIGKASEPNAMFAKIIAQVAKNA